MGFKELVSGLGNRNSDFKELVKQRRMEKEAEYAVLSSSERFLQKERDKLRREQLDKERDKIIKGWETKAKNHNPLNAKNVWKGKHYSDLCNCPSMFKNKGNNFGFGGGL